MKCNNRQSPNSHMAAVKELITGGALIVSGIVIGFFVTNTVTKADYKIPEYRVPTAHAVPITPTAPAEPLPGGRFYVSPPPFEAKRSLLGLYGKN